MKLTDNILNDYRKLMRNKNTWGFVFSIKDVKTLFSIEKINTDYLVFINQRHLGKSTWQNSICLGVVYSMDDLEELFLSITRGEHLS